MSPLHITRTEKQAITQYLAHVSTSEEVIPESHSRCLDFGGQTIGVSGDGTVQVADRTFRTNRTGPTTLESSDGRQITFTYRSPRTRQLF